MSATANSRPQRQDVSFRAELPASAVVFDSTCASHAVFSPDDAVCGFLPLITEGHIVTNDVVRALRDEFED